MEQESLNQWTDDLADRTVAPNRCLSFTVRGPWGHFRRVEGNIVKQTYRIIPRTTVAGLIAGMLGIERDGYYHLFSPDASAIAIEPTRELRTVNMPMNTLSTAKADLTSLNPRGKISVKLPDPTKLRQQHNYEVLVDPGYRIDISLANSARYRQLREILEAGKSHYIPSLGLSEYLAKIEYHGEFDVEDSSDENEITVDSAVPDAIDNILLSPKTRCQIEESPSFMTTDDGGRMTTDYTTYTYNPDAGSLEVSDMNASQVDGRTVVFV